MPKSFNFSIYNQCVQRMNKKFCVQHSTLLTENVWSLSVWIGNRTLKYNNDLYFKYNLVLFRFSFRSILTDVRETLKTPLNLMLQPSKYNNIIFTKNVRVIYVLGLGNLMREIFCCRPISPYVVVIIIDLCCRCTVIDLPSSHLHERT
jgi:hypothetical protein